MRDWAKILKPWIDSRKLEGKALQDDVWRKLTPLRDSISRKSK